MSESTWTIYGNRVFAEGIKRPDLWRKSGNKKIQEKITDLTKSILETPFEGIGKPEPLKYKMTGLWSRRISKADRLVYEVQDQLVIFHSLKGHY